MESTNQQESTHDAQPEGSTDGGLLQELEASRATEREAVERLRQALLDSEPMLDPSMVHGATVAEVEASFAAARAVLTRLRDVVAKETAGKVPAGAPGRSRFHARTPFEKIREGLANQKPG